MVALPPTPLRLAFALLSLPRVWTLKLPFPGYLPTPLRGPTQEDTKGPSLVASQTRLVEVTNNVMYQDLPG